MHDEIHHIPLRMLLDHGFGGALRIAQREAEDRRVMSLFRDRDHARQIWDDWDAISSDGEDAHRYLNLIGDGAYCAV